VSSGRTNNEPAETVSESWLHVIRRRSFLTSIGLAGAALPAEKLLAQSAGPLPPGDADILRFLAAAELIESDLWQQYNELGGVNGGNPAYKAALANLDADMPQYIADNTDDEISHANFINAYLTSRGAQPVNLDQFRTLASTKATGARQVGRLTNLQRLNVDTSWYTRYRESGNPDFGNNFPQAVNIKGEPGIPLNDTETPPNMPQPVPPTTKQAQRMQAIANTAGFHFAFIESGGSSLYPTMALKVTDPEVLRIVVSIGGVEVNHFAIWHDKAGNAVSTPLAPLKDPISGITFPDLNSPPFGGEEFQTNLIMPEPCVFISRTLPVCSIIRPTSVAKNGAAAAVMAFLNDQLFFGQSQAFLDAVMNLAAAADAATRS
jgi:hypothetical protein